MLELGQHHVSSPGQAEGQILCLQAARHYQAFFSESSCPVLACSASPSCHSLKVNAWFSVGAEVMPFIC